MKKTRNILLACFALMLIFCSGAWARTMTFEFTNIWMDHNDTLYIDGGSDTLQWYYHGENEPVGLWRGRNVDTQIPMHIKITDEGNILMDRNWKIWNTVPVYGTPAWSPALSTGIDIPFGLSVTSVVAQFEGRDTARLDRYNLGDREMKLYFYDGFGGADYYKARIDINYDIPDIPGVPEPASMILLGIGLIGLTAIRRKLS